MLVQGQRSFSHEEFRGVVYSKYIQSPETMVRLHIQMARYFARLPASDRKVGMDDGTCIANLVCSSHR